MILIYTHTFWNDPLFSYISWIKVGFIKYKPNSNPWIPTIKIHLRRFKQSPPCFLYFVFFPQPNLSQFVSSLLGCCRLIYLRFVGAWRLLFSTWLGLSTTLLRIAPQHTRHLQPAPDAFPLPQTLFGLIKPEAAHSQEPFSDSRWFL